MAGGALEGRGDGNVEREAKKKEKRKDEKERGAPLVQEHSVGINSAGREVAEISY